MVSAQIRDELEERYETARGSSSTRTKSDFLREVIDEGLRSKETDILDAIDASDELRAAVEERREEGERLDDAVRRLLRGGVASGGTSSGSRRSRRDRIITGVGGGVVAGVPVTFALGGVALGGFVGGLLGALLAIVLSVAAFAFGDLVGDAVGRFQAWAADVLEQEAARNRSQ